MVANVLLRLPAVLFATGTSRSALYAKIKAGLFTKPVKIGPRASAWPQHEVEVINAARITGKSEAEIQNLVAELHANRTSA